MESLSGWGGVILDLLSNFPVGGASVLWESWTFLRGQFPLGAECC